MSTIRTQIAHRVITYTHIVGGCFGSARTPSRKVFDVYVYDNGDVRLYPDTNPATLTREEWNALVRTVESVELPTPEPETTKDVVESSESVAIATDV